MDLYLVRHTAPDVAPGVCYGQSDVGVLHTFETEVEALRPKLAHLGLNDPGLHDEGHGQCAHAPGITGSVCLYSSPLQRCLLLARAVAGNTHMANIQQDDRLKELHFGDWELQSWDDIPRGLLDVWADEHVMQAPPNGESFHALFLRAKSFVDEIAASGQSQHLVFTHAGVIRAITGYALELPLSQVFRLQIDYASVTKIILDPKAHRIAYVNR